jgi:hypothetical protein
MCQSLQQEQQEQQQIAATVTAAAAAAAAKATAPTRAGSCLNMRMRHPHAEEDTVQNEYELLWML